MLGWGSFEQGRRCLKFVNPLATQPIHKIIYNNYNNKDGDDDNNNNNVQFHNENHICDQATDKQSVEGRMTR